MLGTGAVSIDVVAERFDDLDALLRRLSVERADHNQQQAIYQTVIQQTADTWMVQADYATILCVTGYECSDDPEAVEAIVVKALEAHLCDAMSLANTIEIFVRRVRENMHAIEPEIGRASGLHDLKRQVLEARFSSLTSSRF